MTSPKYKQSLFIILFAFIGWLFCGAIMGIGPTFMSMQTTLIVHAIGGPLGFMLLSVIYYRKFLDASPLKTALSFSLFVFLMDLLIVALLIVKSFAMFQSFIGTWLPFILIFLVTYLTGHIVSRKR